MQARNPVRRARFAPRDAEYGDASVSLWRSPGCAATPSRAKYSLEKLVDEAELAAHERRARVRRCSRGEIDAIIRAEAPRMIVAEQARLGRPHILEHHRHIGWGGGWRLRGRAPRWLERRGEPDRILISSPASGAGSDRALCLPWTGQGSAALPRRCSRSTVRETSSSTDVAPRRDFRRSRPG